MSSQIFKTHRLRITNHGTAEAEQKAVCPSRQACRHLGARAGSAGAGDRRAGLARVTVAGKGQQQQELLHNLAMGAGVSGDPGTRVSC